MTFVSRKFGNVERNSHCDVLHIAPVRVANLVLDCNGDFAIKAYDWLSALPAAGLPQWLPLLCKVETHFFSSGNEIDCYACARLCEKTVK